MKGIVAMIPLLLMTTAALFAEPPPHAKWRLIPELSDEFDGDGLDTTKWHPNNPDWQGRQPAWFSPDNVTVRDGKLHLTMRLEDRPGLPEGYHTYTSAAVKSKATVRYGYFEIKARAMDSRGSSAFWFYRAEPDWWTEIDVFEMGAGAPGREHDVYTTVHVFRTPEEDRHWQKGETWKAPYRLADEYHVYALEWNPDYLAFYVDGEMIRRIPNTHWHQPLHMNFDSETMPEWFGLPEPETLPSTFSIEYVRSWQRYEVTGERSDAER